MPRIVLLIVLATAAFAADADRPRSVAPTTTEQQQPTGGGGFSPQGLLIPAMIVAFMWFILIRPQRKEEKRRKELMASLKRGDRVVTIGGLHGEVVAVGEATIDLKAGVDGGRDIVMRFNKGAVQAAPVAEPAKETK
jgi:preprotein translocase subunit YajC